MLVRMKVGMSGTINGDPWPPEGGVIDLPDPVGVKVCAAGQGEPVVDRDADVETTNDTREVEVREDDTAPPDTRDRDSIIRDLESLDQKVDRRKSTETLLQELEAATAPDGEGSTAQEE